MTNTIKNFGRKIAMSLATGLVALTALAGNANSQTNQIAESPKYSARTRYEDTRSPGMDFSKTTLEAGINNVVSTRTYIYSGDKGNYISTGFNNWDLGSIYGNFDEKRGIGIEPNLVLGNAHLIGTLERDQKNRTNREGAEANYTFSDLTLGAACDSVAGKESYLANATFRNLPNIYGAALKEGEEVDSALAFFGHFGPKEKWGTRTWAKYDHVHETDARVFTFDSITAENPTFFEIPHISSYTFLTSRNSIESGVLGKSLVENPSATERTPLNNRAKKGIVSEINVCATDKEDKTTGNARADLGYTFSPILKIKPGAEVFYSHDISGEGKNKTGASAIVSFNGLCLETILTHDTSTSDNSVYVSATFSKSF